MAPADLHSEISASRGGIGRWPFLAVSAGVSCGIVLILSYWGVIFGDMWHGSTRLLDINSKSVDRLLEMSN